MKSVSRPNHEFVRQRKTGYRLVETCHTVNRPRRYRDVGMDEIFSRFWENIADRLHGPLAFRLILQPVIAMFFATRDGYRDAVAKRPPYFWALFTDPAHRRELLAEGWKAVVRVYVFALIIDGVYQVIVFRWIYPVEALVVAFLLAFLPYLLIRGPINRGVRRYVKGP